VAIDAKADGSFAADVFLGGALPAAELVLQLRNLDGSPVGSSVAQAVPAGATQVRVAAATPAPATWSRRDAQSLPGRVYAAHRRRAPATHTLTQRFGFRTFELRPGDGLYVNGRKIVMKGVCRHSFWPETGRTLPTRQREDIRLIKEANMNAVRMSHYPPDAEFLDLCDEAGLYVLDDSAAGRAPTTRRPAAGSSPASLRAT
jgi:beta-galactosidase/beta-glucuronidase